MYYAVLGIQDVHYRMPGPDPNIFPSRTRIH
jgi:hypothetical protein